MHWRPYAQGVAGPLHHGERALSSLTGALPLPTGCKGGDKARADNSSPKVHSKIRVQSPFFIKVSKQGTEEKWKASKLTIREETKMREKKGTAILKVHPAKQPSTAQWSLKAALEKTV